LVRANSERRAPPSCQRGAAHLVPTREDVEPRDHFVADHHIDHGSLDPDRCASPGGLGNDDFKELSSEWTRGNERLQQQ